MIDVHEEGCIELQQLAEQADPGFGDVERGAHAVRQQLLLRKANGYRAYAFDLDYLWRWEIRQGDGVMVQSGCSISLASAREAVDHVFAYYRTVGRKARPDGAAQAGSTR